MIEKYEDLLQNMKEDFLIHEHEASAVKAALQWLDENPELAPGQTITESEMDAKWDEAALSTCRPNFTSTVHRFMQLLGFDVIPDPEPTDEELLAGIIRNIDDWQSITSPELLAKYLNTAGVTMDKENR